MKKLVLVATELDGHSGGSFFIASNEKEYSNYIRSLLYYGNDLIYHFSHEKKIDELTIEQYYTGDSGEMSILVKIFPNYKSLENIEFYTRTG